MYQVHIPTVVWLEAQTNIPLLFYLIAPTASILTSHRAARKLQSNVRLFFASYIIPVIDLLAPMYVEGEARGAVTAPLKRN